MNLLIFLIRSANTITKLKTIRNHPVLETFIEILVIVLKRMKNHTEKWVLL